MAERRTLTDGLKATPKPAETLREKQFVYGNGDAGFASGKPVIGRSPVSTKIRSDYAAALKRASLERQLNGLEPSTLQEILEEAIEPWLKQHGYLP